MVRYQADQDAEALRIAIDDVQRLFERLEDNSEAYVLARRAASLLEACLLEIAPRCLACA